jgi:hypothetical protein
VRDRLQAEEQAISREISALNLALKKARAANDESRLFKIVQSLKSARTEHRAQADALLKAEARIILLEKNRGSLVTVDVAKELISRIIYPLTIWLKSLPNKSADGAAICKSGLEVIRDSAADFVKTYNTDRTEKEIRCSNPSLRS